MYYVPFLKNHYLPRLEYAARETAVPSTDRMQKNGVMAPNAHVLTLHEAELYGAGVVPRFEQDLEQPLLKTSYRGRAGAVLARSRLMHVANPVPDAWFDDRNFLSEAQDVLVGGKTELEEKFSEFQQLVRKFLVSKSGHDVEYEELVNEVAEYLRSGLLATDEAQKQLLKRTGCSSRKDRQNCTGEVGVHDEKCKCALMKLGASEGETA